ncbi:MAG TPA: radical SAM protein [Thermoprotei archaeon]|nr:radical SAM protein [Thermoprotei archaeon]
MIIMIKFVKSKHAVSFVGRNYKACHSLLTIDFMGPCPYRCVYCYVRDMPYIYSSWGLKNRFDLEAVLWYNKPELLKKYMRQNRDFKFPIRIGALSDIGPPFNYTIPMLRKTLRYALELEYPLVIFTKTPLNKFDELVELFLKMMNKGLIAVAVSITDVDEKIYRRLEPLAPPVNERINFLEWLSDNDIPHILRISPLLQGVTDKEEKFLGILNSIPRSHVVVEYIRTRNKRLINFLMKLGVYTWKWDNIWKYYLAPRNYRKRKYIELREIAHHAGWSYAVCGDPLKNENICIYQDYDDCCTGKWRIYSKAVRKILEKEATIRKNKRFVKEILSQTSLVRYNKVCK